MPPGHRRRNLPHIPRCGAGRSESFAALLRLRPAGCSRSFSGNRFSSRSAGRNRAAYFPGDRQVQSEHASSAKFTLHCESSAHRFRNAPGQRKSQPGPVNLRVADGWTPIKRLENVRQVRLVNSDTTVLNGDTDFSVAEVPRFFTKSTNTDPARRTAILSRIHE